jgi:hypothetical protein
MFALFAAGLFSVAAQAQTARGTFKLPVEARWGTMILAPGEYDFTISDAVGGKILTVRSVETGRAGMILASNVASLGSEKGSMLLLSKSDSGTYVKSLSLGDSGVMLNYTTPKSSKLTRLSPPQPATVASASGAQ